MKKTSYLIATILLMIGVLVACGDNGGGTKAFPTVTVQASANTEMTVMPTETPTPEPTSTPTPSLTPTPTPIPHKEPGDFDPKDFFKDVVFCGDSLIHLYRYRAGPSTHPEIFGDRNASEWLTKTSYCARIAVKDVKSLPPSYQACCPTYRGAQVNLWDAIPLTGKTRVFMFFGLNDIGMTLVDGFITNYIALIEHIKETTPDAKFYIMSITPMRKDMQTVGRLCNDNIHKANARLQQMCEENGWTYVDVASGLCDANGNLIIYKDGKAISDGSNVHLTAYGYLFWDEALEKLAREELLKEYYEKAAQGE